VADTRTFSTVIGSTKPGIKTSLGKMFDGQKDFIDVPPQANLDPLEVTVEAWVNPASIPNQDELRRWLVNKNVHEEHNGHYGLVMKGDQLGAYLNIDGKIELFSSGLLKANVWQHVAFTYNGVSLRLFYNGTEVALLPVNKPRKPGDKPLTIGRRQDGYDKSCFHGRIDDVRVYNRALDDKEIRSHWLRPDVPSDKPEQGLVYQQRF
jgi:hypothetical protein